MANCVDPDQMLHSVASDLGLRCLLRSICLNICSKYDNIIFCHIYDLFGWQDGAPLLLKLSEG